MSKEENSGFTVNKREEDFNNIETNPQDEDIHNPYQNAPHTIGIAFVERTREEEIEAGARIKL